MNIQKRAGCGHCAYWELMRDRSSDGYQNEGICRRRAPTAIPSADAGDDGSSPNGSYGVVTAWPRTFAETDWCGEFAPIAEAGGREA